jgi:hypothetical protein
LNYRSYSTNSQSDELVIQSIDHIENKAYPGVSELYNSDRFDFLQYNGEIKMEDNLYEHGNCIWNFEDYFTI